MNYRRLTFFRVFKINDLGIVVDSLVALTYTKISLLIYFASRIERIVCFEFVFINLCFEDCSGAVQCLKSKLIIYLAVAFLNEFERIRTASIYLFKRNYNRINYLCKIQTQHGNIIQIRFVSQTLNKINLYSFEEVLDFTAMRVP